MSRTLIVGLFLLSTFGCSTQHTPTTVETNIGQLSVYFGQFRQAHQGRGPKDEAEFLAFLKKQPALDEATAAALLISPRDKQAYVVRYKNQPPPGGVILHEATGVNGVRIAVNVNGQVLELDETQFQSLRIPGA